MNKPFVVGLRGKKSTGKNYVANVAKDALENEGFAVETGAFADDLKTFCINVLGLTETQCYGSDADKNSPTRYLWKNLPEAIQRKYPDKSGAMTAREVLQVFGTDVIREYFGTHIWVEALHNKILRSESDYFFITDVRFSNETEIIRSWGGQIWQIDGPQRGERATMADPHPSETELDKDAQIDHIIDNGWDRTARDAELAQQVFFILGK